jgi:hypothetical protein
MMHKLLVLTLTVVLALLSCASASALPSSREAPVTRAAAGLQPCIPLSEKERSLPGDASKFRIVRGKPVLLPYHFRYSGQSRYEGPTTTLSPPGTLDPRDASLMADSSAAPRNIYAIVLPNDTLLYWLKRGELCRLPQPYAGFFFDIASVAVYEAVR